MMRSIRTIGVAAAITASATTAAVVAATPASAVTRHTVCAQDLYVRAAAGGAIIGTLYYGQTFDVTQYVRNGLWAEGFAYGHVNQHGFVQSGWFC